MRTDTKDMPPTAPPNRGKGACFTRVEAVARAISFSCTPVMLVVRRVPA